MASVKRLIYGVVEVAQLQAEADPGFNDSRYPVPVLIGWPHGYCYPTLEPLKSIKFPDQEYPADDRDETSPETN